jgi:hypothetical protein
MLRSLFKGMRTNTKPSDISSALGRYAGYLAQTKDSRVNLADEFFQAAMNVSAESPDPRAVHTYHWFLCSQKKDFRSITQYERLRARVPIRGIDASAMIAELGPMSGIGGAQAELGAARRRGRVPGELPRRALPARRRCRGPLERGPAKSARGWRAVVAVHARQIRSLPAAAPS